MVWIDRRIGLFVAIIISALMLALTCLFPLSGDNALYMYMAQLLTKGHVPYLGSWDVNYPGIVFLHLLHVLPFGGSVVAFHAFDALLQLGGVALIYALSTQLFQRVESAVIASLAVTAYYVAGGLALYGERDVYVALLIVAALVAMFAQRPRQDLAALLCGLGVLIRPTAALYVLAFIAWILSTSSKRFSRSVMFGIIASLPLLSFVLWYALIGGIDEFIEATYFYNMEVYARVGLSLNDLEYLVPHSWFIWAAPLGIYAIWRREPRAGLLLILTLLASVLSLVPVYRFPYHFHPLMVLLYILSAGGWVRAAVSLIKVPRLVMALSLLIALGWSSRLLYKSPVPRVLRIFIDAERDGLMAAHRSLHPGQWGKAVQDSLADYLRKNLREGEMAQLLTAPMTVPLMAGIEPASRFTSIYNLVWRSSKTNQLVPRQLEWRREFISELLRPNCKFVVTSSHLPDHVFNNGYLPENVVAGFPVLANLISQRFRRTKVIGGYLIYERQ